MTITIRAKIIIIMITKTMKCQTSRLLPIVFRVLVEVAVNGECFGRGIETIKALIF